jgi:asparagine synthase (glutamine-hydrolysing)
VAGGAAAAEGVLSASFPVENGALMVGGMGVATLADNDLPKVVGATAVAGTDVRFPFLDDRVVDLSLRLPPDYKLRGLALRWFFKQASRGFLPDAILRKKKHGFGLPFGLWLIGHAPLQELAFESVRALGRRGIVRPEFVERLLGRHVHEHPAYYGELVFIFTMLEQWLAAQRPPTVS